MNNFLNDPVAQHHSLTAALNIHGWHHLDAVLLAALATEAPLLLIGPHGTAKTLLVERLSAAMNLAFRHYNASLINYDDLVGIPVPEEGQDQLRFITTPGAIWDAEFVFFDEISRCRPDLQNKLFPIIHERRVIGMQLGALRYRWAAMNPPSPDNPDFDAASSSLYLGSEPLDPALTDRFPFIVPVPNWSDLSREDRREMLSTPSWRVRQASNGNLHRPMSLEGLVEACQMLLPQIETEYGDWLVDYVIATVDLLQKSDLPQSPRRARMLVQSVIAIHAARCVIQDSEDVDVIDSAEMALLYGMPQTATEVPPSAPSIVAIHRQAWEVASMMDDEIWRQILEELDPIKRVLLGMELQVDDEDMARLITQALNADESEARKVGLATAMFLAFRSNRHLTPAAWEPLAKLAGRVLLPRARSNTLPPNAPDMTLWNEIKPWVLNRRAAGGTGILEANYVLGGFPELWRQHNWREAVAQFVQDLNLFNIQVEDANS